MYSKKVMCVYMLLFLGVCVYTNGQQYQQGATWAEGCDKDCKCTDAAKNIFECTEK